MTRAIPGFAPRGSDKRGRYLAVVALMVLSLGAAVVANAQGKVSDSSTTTSSEALLSGTLVRLMISDRPMPAVSTQRAAPPVQRGNVALQGLQGVLSSITADSLAISEAGTGRRVTVARAYVVRLDTAAGRKSRLLRGLLGGVAGLAAGGLLGSPGGNYGAISLMVIGLPVGVIAGAASGGQRWKRVDLPPSGSH